MQTELKKNNPPQQALWFEEPDPIDIKMPDAAFQLEVSAATICNWLKIGYFVNTDKIVHYLRQPGNSRKWLNHLLEGEHNG